MGAGSRSRVSGVIGRLNDARARRSPTQSRARRVVRTYTPSGFAKSKVPPEIWGDISTYYYNNRAQMVIEEWVGKGKGIYVNWYQSDPYMIFPPWDRKTRWHTNLMPFVESWANTSLEKTDIYGMRVYREGATLQQHVDREDTHALSLIINVAQLDVREPWPVHIRHHTTDEDHEVFLEPGELLFYEARPNSGARARAVFFERERDRRAVSARIVLTRSD